MTTTKKNQVAAARKIEVAKKLRASVSDWNQRLAALYEQEAAELLGVAQ